MKIPILRAKLTAPPLPANYLPRPRLDRRWEEWTDKRVILITAGAGFGKTSLVAARARALGRRCLWYTFDESDADPGSFRAHLAWLAAGRPGGVARSAVAKSAVSGRAVSDRAVFDSTVTGGAGAASAVLARLADALQSRGPGSLLVFDDLHLAAGQPAVGEFLDRLLRVLPESATVVLSSRESIDAGLARQRAGGRVAVLAAADLRLTSDEVAAMYRGRHPDTETPIAVFERVVRRTEGWAAGVEILLQNLDSSGAKAIDAALARMTAAGTGWFAYFAEEVLCRLDAPTQDFVCRCALLPRLDPVLCDTVLQRTGSRAMLQRLSERNLFTFAGEGHPPVFRFHRLFRDFLREQLERRCAAGEIRTLQRRIARTLAGEGAWVEALTAFVESGDSAGALRLVDRAGEALLVTGQHQAVERALARLPEDQARRHAGALHVRGRIRDLQARWGEAEVLYRAALRRTTVRRRRAELWRLLGRLHCRRGRYAESRSCCQRAQAELGARDGHARAGLMVQIAVSACELGRIEEAEGNFRRAIALFRRRGDRFEVARTQCLLAANVCRVRGDFARGRDLVRQTLLTFEALAVPRQVCHAICMLADLTLLAGDRRGASTLAAEGLRRAEALEFPSVAAHARQTLGRIAMAEGDLALARTHLEATLETGEALEEQEFAVLPRLGLAEIALAQGNRPAARILARAALASAQRARTPWQSGKCHLLLGRLAASPAAARRRWQEAEALFRRIGARYDQHHAWLLLLAAGAVPRPGRRTMLRRFLAGVARLEHDVLLREVEPEAGASVLAEALRLGIEAEYAAALLTRLGSRAVAPLGAMVDAPGAGPRAIELLSMIGGTEARLVLARVARRADRTGRAAREELFVAGTAPPAPLEIRTLGPFEVTAGPRRLTHADWKSARALRLFLLLLHHRFRWVPREALIESLWPETDPARGWNSLRQSVHLLRGALEPGLAAAQPSRYVRVRHEACRLDPGEAYRYDVEELESALQQAERLWNAAPSERSRVALQEALARYTGEFLAEYPYEEFAATDREYLRERVLVAVARLLDLLAGARDWTGLEVESRRALLLDPCRESHHRHLVMARLRLGHRREALAACDAYEAKVVREMGLPPSARMRALTEEVLSLGRSTRRS